MFNSIIAHTFAQNQESTSRIDEVVQNVFCPMCEVWHINDTQCQRSD